MDRFKVGMGMVTLMALAGLGLVACGGGGGGPRTVGPPLHTFTVKGGGGQKFTVALPGNANYAPPALDSKHPGITKQGWWVQKTEVLHSATAYVAPNAGAAEALVKQGEAPPDPMTPAAPVSGHPAWIWQGTAVQAALSPSTASMGYAEDLMVLDGNVVYSVWAASPSKGANAAFIRSFSVEG